MKCDVIECAQGSAEWFDARLGRPTASRFGDIITATGKARDGKTPRSYLLELLGERLTRCPTQHFETAAMIRGTELEPRAREWYQFTRDVVVTQVGICVSKCGRFGGSPDGLVGELRGIEIKCPMQATFLDVAESGAIPEDHYLQMQGLMWLTGFAQWEYVLYTDAQGLQPQIYTVNADEKIHAAMDLYLPAFAEKLDRAEARMREAGHGINKAKEIDNDIFNDPFIP